MSTENISMTGNIINNQEGERKMINNSFEQGTIGYNALQMIQQTADGGYVFIKDEETKKVLEQQNRKGANIKLGVGTHQVTQLTITEVMAALNTDGVQSGSLSGKLIVDYAEVVDKEDKTVAKVNVCPAKAASRQVQDITEGRVDSIHLLCQEGVTLTNNGTEINTDMRRKNIPQTKAAERDAQNDIVTKTIAIENVELIGIVALDSLYDYETFNDLKLVARRLMEDATIEAYKKYYETFGTDKNAMMTSMRLMNMTMVNNIIKQVYESRYGEIKVNENNASEKMEDFIGFSKKVKAKLSLVGGMNNLFPYTLKLGIQAMAIKTSTSQRVSSTRKVSRVKTNAVGSYFYSENIDTGILTGVFHSIEARDEFLSNDGKMWLKAALDWYENEVRYFLDLPTVEKDYSGLKSKAKTCNSKSKIDSLELLDPTNQFNHAQMKREFVTKLVELATSVIDDRDRDIAEKVTNVLSNFEEE